MAPSSPPLSASRAASLKPALDRLYLDFDREDSAADPVHIVRRFEDPDDREVVGLCAAALAFGRVASVLGSIESLLAVMGPHPARFTRDFSPRRDGSALAPLVHRWTTGTDLAGLLFVLRHMLRTSGTIESFFLEGLTPGAADVGQALETFVRRARTIDLRPIYGPGRAGAFQYFFPMPSAGSACKRLNLFLRWMVRSDAIDLGVWSRVPRAKLIVPLDTHVIRVGQCLRLTSYRTPGWKMAAEITASLRRIDPDDPVKYDFSLCHLGMSGLCGFERSQGGARCPLRGTCRPKAS